MEDNRACSQQRRLWIFEHYAVPPTMSGFVRQYDHARFLEKHGWTSRIFASAFSHKAHRNERDVSPILPSRSQREEGVEFTWVYTTPYTGNNWKRYLNMLAYFVNAQIASFGKERPDAILAASPHLLAAFAGYLIAKRLRVPFILEVQDLWPDSLIQLGLSNPAIIWVLRTIETFLYKNSDAVVTLTRGISDGVARVVDSDKITLVPNGASSLIPIAPDERRARRDERGWKDSWVAMWTGAHGKANHLDTIIDAARIIASQGRQDVRFVLVGDGPEKPRLREMASGLQNVEFIDPLPKTEVGPLLQLADVGLIVHSDTEAVRGARPTKLTEYMGAGLPVISNLQGECAGLIELADCGVTVPTMNPGKLAEAVLESTLDPEAFSYRGASGTAFLSATHDRELLAGQLAKLLTRIMGTQKRE